MEFENRYTCKRCDEGFTLVDGRCEVIDAHTMCNTGEAWTRNGKCSMCTRYENAEEMYEKSGSFDMEDFHEVELYYPESGRCGVIGINVLLVLLLLVFIL